MLARMRPYNLISSAVRYFAASRNVCIFMASFIIANSTFAQSNSNSISQDQADLSFRGQGQASRRNSSNQSSSQQMTSQQGGQARGALNQRSQKGQRQQLAQGQGLRQQSQRVDSQNDRQSSSRQQSVNQEDKRRYLANKQAKLANAEPQGNKDVRQFHEVLNDLLTEFSYDVKSGQINGLKNLSIRRVSVSDALPKSYESYVELLVTERIRENSKVRIINCVSCKSKSSVLTDGKLMITSPMTNLNRMDEAATQLNIENFMDVILVYHTTHMVLAFSVFNTTTKEEVYSRTYNSETLRSKYQKMAVDMKQVELASGKDEYQPEYRFLLGFSGSSLPNVAGEARDKSFLGLHIRAVEKFDNRKFDFGLISSFWVNTATLLRAYPAEGEQSEETTTTYSGAARPLPYKYVLGLQAILARNFFGEIEAYDRIRHGIHFGLGGIISTGYLAPSARIGWDIYFGRRWTFTLSSQYILESNILVGKEYQKSPSGVGGDLGLSLNL
ncbi:MAG: hypothetical protein NT027_06335 [Proteobacteria bacterium]|nr:hypothetical protein [Pseudomonadota bacterium]